MDFPKTTLIKQHFDPQKIDDPAAEVKKEIAGLGLAETVKPGQTAAVTAGSRGIRNIDIITRTVVDELKNLGLKPFIVPAMGSHGGATAEGQAKVLAGFGITEDSMGCPIKSSMDVEYLGDAGDGYPVYVDKYAAGADHLVVINRIKPHTKFEGPVESGLMKMMAIGLGKHKGAQYYHRAAIRLTFQRIVENVGLEVMQKRSVLFGLGVVENGFDETCMIKAFLPSDLLEGEKELLKLAKARMARLPFDDIDILVVDLIGKDISGTGMDINVTGRNRDLLGDFTSTPRIKRIFVRDLSPATEGNANGIGFADFTTTRLVNKVDRPKTYMNSLTAISPEKGAIPMYFDTDREALDACFMTIGDIRPSDSRLVYIQSTMHLTRLMVSEAYADDIEARDDLEMIGNWAELSIGADGNMISPFLD
jgi:hypothetical protein